MNLPYELPSVVDTGNEEGLSEDFKCSKQLFITSTQISFRAISVNKITSLRSIFFCRFNSCRYCLQPQINFIGFELDVFTLICPNIPVFIGLGIPVPFLGNHINSILKAIQRICMRGQLSEIGYITMSFNFSLPFHFSATLRKTANRAGVLRLVYYIVPKLTGLLKQRVFLLFV